MHCCVDGDAEVRERVPGKVLLHSPSLTSTEAFMGRGKAEQGGGVDPVGRAA